MMIDNLVPSHSLSLESHVANVQLICLPSAGSSASLYQSWRKFAPQNIKIATIEYPGHGAKVKEPLVGDPAVLANRIAQEIRAFADFPIVLFGHSLGAALLWRVLRELEADTHPVDIVLVVVSGRPEHRFIHDMPKRHNLDSDAMLHEIKKYNNFPKEIQFDKDALGFFLNIFKNDFLLNDLMLNDEVFSTAIPLLALYGKSDPEISSVASMEAWASRSLNWQGCHALKGDHFYFKSDESLREMFNIINLCIGKIVSE